MPTSSLNEAIQAYNAQQATVDRDICDLLAKLITQELGEAESKIWHGHPVWFIKDNPIVGYSKQKKGIRLMFWSGLSFEEKDLSVEGKKFKDASIFYTAAAEIQKVDINRWLKKARTIQWDYKNIVKRKGLLIRLD